MSIFTINSFPKRDDPYILIWPSSWRFITALSEKMSNSTTLHSFPSAPFQFTGPQSKRSLDYPCLFICASICLLTNKTIRLNFLNLNYQKPKVQYTQAQSITLDRTISQVYLYCQFHVFFFSQNTVILFFKILLYIYCPPGH